MVATHYVKKNALVWDTTNDSDGGCQRLMNRRTDVVIAEPIPPHIRRGDLVQFETFNGRTVWADDTSYEPLG